MSARLQLSVNVLLASSYSTETSNSALKFPAEETYLREALDLLGLLHMSVMATRACMSFIRSQSSVCGDMEIEINIELITRKAKAVASKQQIYVTTNRLTTPVGPWTSGVRDQQICLPLWSSTHHSVIMGDSPEVLGGPGVLERAWTNRVIRNRVL